MAEEKQDSGALSEKDGVTTPTNLSKQAAATIKQKRKQSISVETLVAQLKLGDTTALSRAITYIESEAPQHQNISKSILEQCLQHAVPSFRIGITGVPGVGKSTFIERFGTYLTKKGHRVAVLAVDPSSTVSRGSILGDKTRMESLVKDPNAYIRPSSSGTSLGGVARKTREAIILCEAAGFDTIIIETVGVGQSETAVHSMTDFFLLLKLAGAGDELQGMKRGIMEMADAIVINKADGDNVKAAKLARTEFNRALHLFPPKESQWTPKAMTCSALKDEGIDTVWEALQDYLDTVKDNGYFSEKRKQQNRFWLLQTIENTLQQAFFSNVEVKKAFEAQLERIHEQKTTPFEAAAYLLSLTK
ncbi:methylmalonyl Co-A mutase-associated GTPase MeaB [Altibacter sp. HG106]|uniref:methylmalonyl Co-A mutase-associated GTPase MeaB n=1 Tax=Altibacter sp. HG106 TaxID=3023937 RepID=UPI00234FC111|nr:methylmalonyl Co-A mutase-associated GTPase MeaB [Altibacter sp. HG106]MDC7995745.1 methylmalonyl Co-A mutase-associated GTPase MeaB [Altibacter sp. HG106]